MPQPETQYDQLLGPRNAIGQLDPCYRTSFFGGVEEFSLFDPDTGGIQPCWKTTRQGGVVTSEHFHPLVSAIIPCWRTTVAEGQATLELFDLAAGDIVPCVRVVSQMGADGSLGPVEVTVDPDEDVTVRVGNNLVYRLVGGVLVLDTIPPDV